MAPVLASSFESALDTANCLKDLREELVSCSRSGDIARAEELLESILRIQGVPDECVDDYNAILHTCTQAGDMERVEIYLTQMEEHGPEPNMRTYNSVINACAAQGDVARTEGLIERMRLRGIQPNFVTYSTICKVYARMGAIEQIEQVMTLVEEYVGPLNEYFFASLISACGKSEPPQPERAETALGELVRRGLKAQSVKRALSRVVGEERTAHLLKHLGQARANTSPTSQAPLPPGPVPGQPADSPTAATTTSAGTPSASPPGSSPAFMARKSAVSAGSGSSTDPGTSPQGSSNNSSASDTSSGKGQRARPSRLPDGGKAASAPRAVGAGGTPKGAAKGTAKGAAKGGGGVKAKPQLGSGKTSPTEAQAQPRHLAAGDVFGPVSPTTATFQQVQPQDPYAGHRMRPSQMDQYHYQAQPRDPYYDAGRPVLPLPHHVDHYSYQAYQQQSNHGSYVPGSALLQAASLPVKVQITCAEGLLGCGPAPGLNTQVALLGAPVGA